MNRNRGSRAVKPWPQARPGALGPSRAHGTYRGLLKAPVTGAHWWRCTGHAPHRSEEEAEQCARRAQRRLTEEDLMDVPQVTLLTQDGREVSCTLHRDSALDRPEGDPAGHVLYFRAVPDEPVELGTYEVQAVCPPHTAFHVDVPQPGLMESLQPGPVQS